VYYVIEGLSRGAFGLQRLYAASKSDKTSMPNVSSVASTSTPVEPMETRAVFYDYIEGVEE